MTSDGFGAAKQTHGDPLAPVAGAEDVASAAEGVSTDDLAARAEGPVMVVEGPSGAPSLVVLDPSGAAKHAEVPATWRPLTERRRLVWCRLPADGSLAQAERLLADRDVLGRPVDVVTSGPAVPAVVDLLGHHPGAVRALLLVDPGANADGGVEPAPVTERREELRRAGVVVETVAQSPGGTRDRVEPPMPMGHPDVVDAVERALASLDWQSDDRR
ncbi:hypothetical protein SAMN05421810_10670 [Amycolatopsis arida]|uniref:Alpha/beta hydrolase n=1 Tax=Amycolatopsis arida TaxID=587909 RepID=A0A1I5XHI2_9PSEU|nr:hypothetical protein [Amycolatopsis arida]TDX97447.1 hypothetical protein CLV69_102551 [Amycolatopsis arida]SFQ31422.1 hypothetical protein SAMN05421810_10670 [Amycolatopsis arida]